RPATPLLPPVGSGPAPPGRDGWPLAIHSERSHATHSRSFSMTAAELNPEFRSLIDARLDAIEQILLRVQVSYSERRHIVSEVETQIFELLARRGENPTREDVV